MTRARNPALTGAGWERRRPLRGRGRAAAAAVPSAMAPGGNTLYRSSQEAARGRPLFCPGSTAENMALDRGGEPILVVRQCDGLRGALDRIAGIGHRDAEPGLAEHLKVVVHVPENQDFVARHAAEPPGKQLDQTPLVDPRRDDVAVIGLRAGDIGAPGERRRMRSVSFAIRSWSSLGPTIL